MGQAATSLAYAALSGVGRQAYPAKKSSPFLFLGFISLGIALEIAQTNIPGRNGSVADAVAAGFLLVAVVLNVVGNRGKL